MAFNCWRKYPSSFGGMTRSAGGVAGSGQIGGGATGWLAHPDSRDRLKESSIAQADEFGLVATGGLPSGFDFRFVAIDYILLSGLFCGSS